MTHEAYTAFKLNPSPTNLAHRSPHTTGFQISRLLCFLLAMMPWYTVYDPWIIETAVINKAVVEAARINLELVYVGKNNAKERLKKNIATINVEQLSHYWPNISSVSLFWVRLESMLYSKLQKTVENDYIMQEVMTMLSFDGSDQGWAILFRGSDEMARAN
nr:protein sieve element occlusion b [Quercus suber]